MASHPSDTPVGVVTKPSPRSVAATVDRLQRLLADKGLMIFAVIDHSGEAKRAGLTMPDTKLVIFGSPTAGTPVMVVAPLAALDLPLKLLVWEDSSESVWVSYNSPSFLAKRHRLSDVMRERLEPIEAMSDAVIAADT
ncbi:MAG TPA: DUF302 domain-containing protein [Acidimicrobiia bacterium]|nr:DUF302 domain-containing protein [Acidimicrobiia bacterium]